MLRVTLQRSAVKGTERQQATIRGLGLRKLRQCRDLTDTPETRGMINKVIHLVDFEVIDETASVSLDKTE
jgi:large subunit ribosomal protein L30